MGGNKMTNPLNEKATYLYTDEAGNTLFTKERYVKKDGSKGYAYSHVVNGETIRTMPQFDNGTPLYNLHRLAKYPTQTVYLVEGEKCVDALTKLKLLATTSGGAQSDDKADWQPLAGREVNTLADNDEAGLGYIQRATEKLKALNATVKQIDIDQLNLPAKGDCVDWLAKFESEHDRPATKVDIEALPVLPDAPDEHVSDLNIAGDGVASTKRPSFVVHIKDDGDYAAGVWYLGVKDGNDFDQRIASPIQIEAVTHDDQENNFGRLLRFLNTNGVWREWAMPMELLKGKGDEVRGELLSMGVSIDPKANNLLNNYLQTSNPAHRVCCALQTGWHGNSFVLPDEVIGEGAGKIILQTGDSRHVEYTRAGTLEGWRNGISMMAINNPMLMLAISSAFTGALFYKVHGESGGIHLIGNSSTGKSTAIDAACSVWGGDTYKRSWRATSNGLEGAAAMFNDGLLALDEISECDPKEVGAIVYALGNGQGKQRAGRTGNARRVTKWRTFILSSGERSVESTMLDAGFRINAGQSVRLLDIPVTRTYGLYDDLKGHTNGALLSDAIKLATTKHYGLAGREFIKHLASDARDLKPMLAAMMKHSVFKSDHAEGQEIRVAGKLAIVALAGELATQCGITGWQQNAAIEAAGIAYKAWLDGREAGNSEQHKIIESVRNFIDAHGDSRFSDADTNSGVKVNNRAGWFRWDGTAPDAVREYLFTSGGMGEALKGYDFKSACKVLVEAGMLIKSAPDKNQTSITVSGGRKWLYVVKLNA